jgi:ABC-type sugar transport system ATPase subunit
MLRLQSVSKSFPGVRALIDVSFEIQRGEIHALIGENGAGKSTLMKILSGVYTDYDGSMLLDGIPLALKNPRDAQRHGIAIIHQELNLIPELSIAENIFLGRELRTPFGSLDRKRMTQLANDLLRRLDLEIDPRRAISTLRVGEQQLVEVAKALSLDARLLILDEPTSALSNSEINRLFGVIRSLKHHGVTMIYISHKFEEIFALADSITVLRDGHHIATMPAAETNQHDLISLMVGRELSDMFPKETGAIGRDVLHVTGLGYSPPAVALKRSLHGISFDLRAGEILGVAGLMGSGRTELLETLFGVHPRRQVSGSIQIAGTGKRLRSPKSALESGIAFVTEDRKTQSLVLRLPVGQNISMASLKSLSSFGFLRFDREREVIETAIEQLRIRTPNANVDVETLSGGNQQKVALAKCLLTQPRILLLDEPTRGIDVGAKAEIYALISQLAVRGTAILMASSELPELLAMCDRILVLREGELVATLDGPTTNQVEIMAAATQRVRPNVA